MNDIGLDIGGANLKCANSFGKGHQQSFAMWREHHRLQDALLQLIPEDWLASPNRISVTMTGELADGFSSRAVGVRSIVSAVEAAFPNSEPKYYQISGELVDAQLASEKWQHTAASNWHASAWFYFQQLDLTDGFLIDIGSTTTDIVPVRAGLPIGSNLMDLDRLRNGQLLYAGVGRTSIPTLIAEVDLNGTAVGIARETFATIRDARIWLGVEAEDSDCIETADSRPATRENCGRRLARVVCADPEDLGQAGISLIAQQAIDALQRLVQKNLNWVVEDHAGLPHRFCLAGQGFELARETIENKFPDAEILLAWDVDGAISVNDALAAQLIPAQAVACRRRQLESESGS